MEDAMRLDYLETKFNKVEEAIASIDKSLQKIVMLEEKHAQTREILTNVVCMQHSLDRRVDVIEIEMPQLIETRKWVVGGIACAMVIFLSQSVLTQRLLTCALL